MHRCRGDATLDSAESGVRGTSGQYRADAGRSEQLRQIGDARPCLAGLDVDFGVEEAVREATELLTAQVRASGQEYVRVVPGGTDYGWGVAVDEADGELRGCVDGERVVVA